MPLNGAGLASKPAGSTAVSNTTIESSRFNAVIDDIYSIFNTARPIAYGGTGAATASAAMVALGGFAVVRQQSFTASGTYTPHANMVYCIIELVGGGGGGGGTIAAGANQALGGGGGGAGAFSQVIASKADIGASKTVTIGAAGTGATAGNNTGGTGGTTSVSTLCTAAGGVGGSGNDGSSTGVGGDGGSTGTGIIQIGDCGFDGVLTTLAAGSIFPNSGWMVSGRGASSRWGAGAKQRPSRNSGFAGVGYGAGGGGGVDWNASAARAGGAGTAGKVIITEYCSA